MGLNLSSNMRYNVELLPRPRFARLVNRRLLVGEPILIAVFRALLPRKKKQPDETSLAVPRPGNEVKWRHTDSEPGRVV